MQVYTSDTGITDSQDPLHVYLGGDGRPFLYDGRYPAADPTGRKLIALELMRRDTGQAVYLGRPCYHGGSRLEPCTAHLWTTARYGDTVITAMQSALQTLIARYRPPAVVLVGYSGGGVIAAALAEKLSLPVFLVTIASNLDVAAWTKYHDYIPLSGSFDPARAIVNWRELPQLHLQGLRDRVVPPATTHDFTDALPSTALRHYAQADHRCCWEPIWEALLREAPWSTEFATRAHAHQ